MAKKAKQRRSTSQQDVFDDDEEDDDVIEERDETETETPPATSKPAPKGNPPPPPEEVCEVVRAITAAFSSALPPAATSGSYDMAMARSQTESGTPLNLLPMPVIPEAAGVPDGAYRVDGSDWIVTVAGEQTVLFERAGATADSERFTAVPAKLP